MESADEIKSKLELIISRCNPLPVIALDLDYTLWEANCFEHTQPPYSPFPPVDNPDIAGAVDNPPILEPGKIYSRIYCHDPRIKADRALDLYNQVKEVVEWFRSQSLLLTVVSKSPSKQVVEGILAAYGMWDWFQYPQVFYSRSKSTHMRNLTEAFNLPLPLFILFDDDEKNVATAKKMGAGGVLVDKAVGLTWEVVLRGLEEWEKSMRAKMGGLERWAGVGERSGSGGAASEQSGGLGPLERIHGRVRSSTDHEEGAEVSDRTLMPSYRPPSSSLRTVRTDSPRSLSVTKEEMGELVLPSRSAGGILDVPPSPKLALPPLTTPRSLSMQNKFGGLNLSIDVLNKGGGGAGGIAGTPSSHDSHDPPSSSVTHVNTPQAALALSPADKAVEMHGADIAQLAASGSARDISSTPRSRSFGGVTLPFLNL
eukprot:gene40388-49220_t